MSSGANRVPSDDYRVSTGHNPMPTDHDPVPAHTYPVYPGQDHLPVGDHAMPAIGHPMPAGQDPMSALQCQGGAVRGRWYLCGQALSCDRRNLSDHPGGVESSCAIDKWPRFVLNKELGQVHCVGGKWAADVDHRVVETVLNDLYWS